MYKILANLLHTFACLNFALKWKICGNNTTFYIKLKKILAWFYPQFWYLLTGYFTLESLTKCSLFPRFLTFTRFDLSCIFFSSLFFPRMRGKNRYAREKKTYAPNIHRKRYTTHRFFSLAFFQSRKELFYSLFYDQNFELLTPKIVDEFWVLAKILQFPKCFLPITYSHYF